MDTTISEITFSDNGICKYCKIHDELERKYPLNKKGTPNLKKLINEIKSQGDEKKYDCLAGISGGADSTYTLYLLTQLGLKPLVMHLDNEWNSSIAEKNIKNVVSKLKLDLVIKKVNWDEFKDLQIAFLKASTPDVEIPTDIGILSTLYRTAAEYDIKYIMSGISFRTEGLTPSIWSYGDGRYIKAINKQFGNVPLTTFPNLTLLDLYKFLFILKIKSIRILNYIDYDKNKAKEIIKKKFNWKDYGGKHYESIYTRFIQSYLLPKKFNIDKRRVHLSALVRSGQITRDKALEEIEKPPYPIKDINKDLNYVLKKLDLGKDEWRKIFGSPPKTFHDYPTYYPLFKKIGFIINFITGGESGQSFIYG